MRKFFYVIYILFLAEIFLHSAYWPMFRSTAQRTGTVSELAEPKLTPLWNYTIQGQFVSSPVVYKGIVYCGGRDCSLWAWDAYTGEILWQYSASGWIDAAPCVSSTTVFVPCKDKNIYAFDRITGDVKWQTYTGSIDCSSPVLYKNILYLISGYPENKVYCINPDNGAMINSYTLSKFGFSSPTIKNNLLFGGTNDGLFHCINLDTGKTVWSKQTAGGIFYSTLAAGENTLYAVSGGDERHLFCLNPATGETIWQSVEIDTRTSVVSSITLSEDKVFVVSSVGTKLKLFAFPVTGTTPVNPLWSTIVGENSSLGIISSPAVADNVAYVGSGDGCLYAVNIINGKYIEPATGNLSDNATGYYLSYTNSPSTGIVSSPAVSNGCIYIGTIDGNFWAFRAEKIAAISSPEDDDLIVNSADIHGTVAGPALQTYKLEYGSGLNPDKWVEISSGTKQVNSGYLGSWNALSAADGAATIRLTVNNDTSKKASVRVTIDSAPQPPKNVRAADTPFDNGGSITLSWDKSIDDGENDNDVAGYNIYRSTLTNNFSLFKQVAKGATEYIDSSCPVYTTFYYYLTAADARSSSENSNTTSAFSMLDGIEILPDKGGTVKLEYDGLATEIVIDPNTFKEKVWVGIKIPDQYPDTGIQKSCKATKIVREFGITPANVKFEKSVTIKIPYKSSDITNMIKENLRIYWRDETKKEWRIINTSDPNIEDGRVWVRVPHFSLYRIMEYLPGTEELLAKDKVYTYPNPAKGDKLYFKYYLGDKADVFIDVYNVAGELISHHEKTNNMAGIASELEWDISNIASGVYIYRVEAKTSSQSMAVKKKLAIVH